MRNRAISIFHYLIIQYYPSNDAVQNFNKIISKFDLINELWMEKRAKKCEDVHTKFYFLRRRLKDGIIYIVIYNYNYVYIYI